MAVAEKQKAERTPAKKVIDITSRHSDEEVIALEERGYRLRFSERDFRDLPETVLEALSHENQRDYWIAKGAAKALAKNAQRKADGFEGLEIPVDPLRAKPSRKLRMEGVPKGWYGTWKRPDEVEAAKELGYVLVPSSVKTPGAGSAATSRTIAAKDGKDDLVAMMIPLKLHEQHLQANALLSRRRAGATIKEVAGLVAKANKHLESVADLPGVTEETTTEEVSIKEDMRRNA